MPRAEQSVRRALLACSPPSCDVTERRDRSARQRNGGATAIALARAGFTTASADGLEARDFGGRKRWTADVKESRLDSAHDADHRCCLVRVAGGAGGADRPASSARDRSLPDVVHACGPGGVRARRRHAPFVLVQLRRQDVSSRARAGSGLRDGLLGHRARSPRQHAGVASVGGGRAIGLGVAREGARDRREDRARAGLARRHSRGLPRPRFHTGRHAAPAVRPGDAGAREEVPGRFRSAGVPCAPAAGVGAEERHHLRAAARIGDPARAPLREAAGTPRYHALPDSRLRLSAVRGEGDRRGAALCGTRPGGSARAPHAGAHLFDGRDVGGLRRVEPVGARDSAGLLSRGGLHRLRAAAAGAGHAGGGDDRHGRVHTRARRSSTLDREFHGARRDAGALRTGACGLEGRRGTAGHHERVSPGRLPHAVRSRARSGAHRQRDRCGSGDRRDARHYRRRSKKRTTPTGPIARASKSFQSRRGWRGPAAATTRRWR